MTAGSYFFFPTTGWQATVAMVKPLGVQVIDAEEDFAWEQTQVQIQKHKNIKTQIQIHNHIDGDDRLKTPVVHRSPELTNIIKVQQSPKTKSTKQLNI